MAKSLDSLIADIYGLFGSGETFDLKYFDHFGEELKALMDRRFHPEGDHRPHLRMSNIGKPDRQLWYDMNSEGPREGFPPATLIKFQYGDVIEQMMLLYAKMAGHEVTDEQAEVSVNGVKGHIDARIDGVVVDVKSCSSYAFQKFAVDVDSPQSLLRPENDAFGYVAQLAGYVHALTPGAEGAFLAVDKTLGKVCLLRVPSEVLAKFDVEARIDHVKSVVSSPDIPARCYPDVEDGKSGNRKLDTGCSYCSWKHQCWPNLRTYYYSSGPRWLTKVVREPKVNEFAGM